MIPLLALFAAAILSACTSTAPTSAPQIAIPTFTRQAPTPSASVFPNEVLVNEIYHRLDIDTTIPDAGRQATISLFMNRPTALFPNNQGLVLVYEVPTVPLTQEETTQIAIMLVGTAVGVAADIGVALSGVEVIFYTDATPFIGFRATPPWGLENIQAAPLAEELRERIEGTPEPRPTMPLSGG